MINAKVVPTKAVIAGLTKELNSDPSYLQEFADEVKKVLGQKPPANL
jgi:hypothetical protein